LPPKLVRFQVGWGVNSAGQIVHTEDAGATWTIQNTVGTDTWIRCMSFTSPTDGWVGSITRRQRLWKTEDGKTWTDMTASLPPLRGRVQADAPLGPATWFRAGGPAEVLVRPADAEDLAALLAGLPDTVPVTAIGAASNLIVRDGGVKLVDQTLKSRYAAHQLEHGHRACHWCPHMPRLYFRQRI